MFEFNLQVNYWMDLNAKKSDNNEIFFSFLLDDFDQSCEYLFLGMGGVRQHAAAFENI